METKNRIIPKVAVPPGFTIKQEIECRGIKQKDFASMLGMHPSNLSELIKGTRSISPAIADKLERALNIPARFWIRMQAEYDYVCEAIRQRDINEYKSQFLTEEYSKFIDVNSIINKMLTDTEDLTYTEIIDLLQNKMQMPKPAELLYDSFQGRFHMPDKEGIDKRAVLTWVVLARYDARQCEATKNIQTDYDLLTEKITETLHINSGNVIEKLKNIFADNGVRFCVTEALPKTCIDGYSFIDDDGTPSIIVTLRQKFIDSLAFSVIHELAHLKLHQKKSKVFINMAEDTREEKEANKYASTALVPEKLWKKRPQTVIGIKQIQQSYGEWAHKNGLNKWLVLGRAAYETGIWKFKNDESRNISEYH